MYSFVQIVLFAFRHVQCIDNRNETESSPEYKRILLSILYTCDCLFSWFLFHFISLFCAWSRRKRITTMSFVIVIPFAMIRKWWSENRLVVDVDEPFVSQLLAHMFVTHSHPQSHTQTYKHTYGQRNMTATHAKIHWHIVRTIETKFIHKILAENVLQSIDKENLRDLCWKYPNIFPALPTKAIEYCLAASSYNTFGTHR